ncbi:3'(2'),5'-bisphosphate nucleotidase CysQ family protein [Acinetobacter sp. HY1485]|uniref:3'(2'),5'-bisphosphate nucleotidase CysQ family protein n=1 Tax=Acinetobacter sp. HY1485 TaxID=2970918 RepID=UPI0022B9AC0F|nr:3'(2'),5'-bisphosphate nucleotidase CysQ [Acinetobacter sp. HY1485]
MFSPVFKPNDDFIVQIQKLLEQASLIALQHYQTYKIGANFNIYEKSDLSPVTQADLAINKFLLKELQKLTPSIPIISEEEDNQQRQDWKKCWLLDPLDGTKEFLAKRDQFTINLSLIEKGKTIFSAIMIPVEQTLYIGYQQQKPFKYNDGQWFEFDELKQNEKLHIGISYRSVKDQYDKFIQNLNEPVELIKAGSAYKFCLMLEGKIDIYPRFHPTSEWDTSAGQGLLESIGGGLVSLQNEPFIYNQRDTLLNAGFIAYCSEIQRTIAFNALHKKSL